MGSVFNNNDKSDQSWHHKRTFPHTGLGSRGITNVILLNSQDNSRRWVLPHLCADGGTEAQLINASS